MKTSMLRLNDLLWPFRLLALVLPLVVWLLCCSTWLGVLFASPNTYFIAGAKRCRWGGRNAAADVSTLIPFTVRRSPQVWCKCTNCHDCERIWNLITFHTRALGLCPENFTHHQKNIRRPEFSPNEFLIKGSLFFPYFYFFVVNSHIPRRSRPPSYMCRVLILMEGANLAVSFAYISQNIRCKCLASQLGKVQSS